MLPALASTGRGSGGGSAHRQRQLGNSLRRACCRSVAVAVRLARARGMGVESAEARFRWGPGEHDRRAAVLEDAASPAEPRKELGAVHHDILPVTAFEGLRAASSSCSKPRGSPTPGLLLALPR